MVHRCSRTAAGRAQALVLTGLTLLAGSCRETPKTESRETPGAAAPPSILLVTLDTTRADAIGPEAAGIDDTGV